MFAQVELMFTVIFSEMALIVLLLFKTPFRKLLIMTLDRVKRGRGPLIVKSVAATVLVMMLYTVYSIQEFQARPLDSLTPTDQVLLNQQILYASIMGFSLFLSLMIDRLHHYIRELRLLRKTMEAAKKQDRGPDNGKNASGEEIKALGNEISKLKEKIKKLEIEREVKQKQVKAAESSSEALKHQSESLLLEYDRLVEENQNLRSQLQTIDHSLSESEGKKNE